MLPLYNILLEQVTNSFMVDSKDLEEFKSLADKLQLGELAKGIEQSLMTFDYQKAEKLLREMNQSLEDTL